MLRDIHIHMGHPWWPPAPGWWIVLAALVLLGFLLWRYDPRWRLYVPLPVITLGTWRWEAAQGLRALRRRLVREPVKPAAAELSELLRRIAMARHGRAACAGLHGEAWLAWLTANDPRGFDWTANARALLIAPYAQPAAANTERESIRALVDAAMEWVAAPDPKPPRPARRPATRRLPGALSKLLRRLRRPARSAETPEREAA
ncbi:DUF4381 domain-containing protein [Thiohalocapsa sp. ML1]|uniref:DUF4381 domain-containing protein n=1 Tax=Thiohalocapsa sp. ML1 TaxID=1431688 RepID=UPI0009E996C6|nr:DUF4381 domain-containing protein [Thiohalocapsa sp. ML1]